MGAVNNNTWTTGINQEVWSPKRTLMRFTLLVEVSKKMHRKNNPHTTFSRLGDPYEQQRRRQWHPTPVLLPGKSHGWRSPVGYTVHGVAQSRTWLSNFTFTFHFHALEKEMATHSSVAAWRIPGLAEPGGLPSMGSHRVGHDWSNLAAAWSTKE